MASSLPDRARRGPSRRASQRVESCRWSLREASFLRGRPAHASRCFTVHAAGHGQSADCAIRQRPEQAVGTSGPVPIARSRLLPSV